MTTIEVTGITMVQLQHIRDVMGLDVDRLGQDTVNVLVPTVESDNLTDWLDAQGLEWRLV